MNASLAAKNVAGAFAVTVGMKGPSRQAPWLLASRNHAVAWRPLDLVLPIGGEQMCYVKEPSGWKIAGFLGGEANQ